jgi:hypothetical protein
MRPSWIPVFLILVLCCCAAFALFPRGWGPAPFQGVLAGLAMYFVAFTRVAGRAVAETGQVPPLFGRRGMAPRVLLRAAAFLAILTGLAYVYFERRSYLDVTWPVLILASWGLAEGLLRSKRKVGWMTR